MDYSIESLQKPNKRVAAIAVLQIWKLRFRARDQKHKCLSYWAEAGNIHGERVYRATAFLSGQLFLGWQWALVCKKAATQYCQVWFFKRSWKSIYFINIKPPNLKKDLVLEQTLENPITAGISHTFLCRFITFLVGKSTTPLLSTYYWWIWCNSLSLCAQPTVVFVEDVS